MKIDNAVLDVLAEARIEGSILVIPAKLDRSLYVAVNKVLEAAGGKWNRKAKGHVFDGDAADIMDQIVLTGEVLNKKQELGDFPSPPAVVARLMEIAQIEPGMRVLEPSAGTGNIAVEMAKRGARPVHCFEINPDNSDKLSARLGEVTRVWSIVHFDFLTVEPPPEIALYDRIVMNPPFAKLADVKHVLHALKFLAPGGRLVSVMSAGITFRTNSLTNTLRQQITEIEPLPEGSFAESGTMVNTVIVTINKRGES